MTELLWYLVDWANEQRTDSSRINILLICCEDGRMDNGLKVIHECMKQFCANFEIRLLSKQMGMSISSSKEPYSILLLYHFTLMMIPSLHLLSSHKQQDGMLVFYLRVDFKWALRVLVFSHVSLSLSANLLTRATPLDLFNHPFLLRR
jgi:hypothetical protein